MAWTAPKTWTAAVTTAADFNTYVRDNMLLLKTPWSSTGKLTALSSSYVASLSGASLTGLPFPGQANTFTAGKTVFGGTSRAILPVGTDKFDGSAGNKTPGSMWVEGNYLHWIAETTKVEWRFLGTIVSTPAGAIVGSVWVEPAGGLNYVDSSGVERQVYLSGAASPHADAAALGGSVWVESTYLHWVYSGGGEQYAHADTHSDGTAHSDVTHTDTHGDVSHGDIATVNVHANHTDVGHADSHGDVPHTDVSHTDSHADVTHADHTDHADVAHDDKPESMGT